METPGYWQKFWSKRVSRRRALAAGAASLGATTFALAGCSSSDSGGTETNGDWTPSPLDTPTPGGKMTYGINVDVGSLDPHRNIASGFLSARIHNPLHAVNMSTQEFQPLVAQKLETPTTQEYIWTLRPGVRFHDVEPTNGRELTADDVKYSFDRFKAGPTLNDRKLLTLYSDIYEAVDKQTFRLKTVRPFSPAVDHIGNFPYSIVPHEAVEKWEDLSTKAAGCGAWILSDYVRGERVRLTRNPNYYQPPRPYPDEEEWLIVPDTGTLWQTFKSGRLDGSNVYVDKFKRSEIEGNKSFRVVQSPSLWTNMCYIRVDRPPFSDERVREALDIGIDREDYIEKLYFGDGNFNGPINWALEYWALPQEEIREALKYDPERAKQLLDAADQGSGLSIDCILPTSGISPDIATIIASHYKRLGVTLNLRPLELGAFLGELYAHNFDMAIFFNLPHMEPDMPLRSYYSKGQSADRNPGMANDPEVDRLIEGIWEIFDLEEKKKAVMECQRVLLKKHGPMYPLCNEIGYVGSKVRVRGLQEGTGLISWLGISYWLEG